MAEGMSIVRMSTAGVTSRCTSCEDDLATYSVCLTGLSGLHVKGTRFSGNLL